MLYVQVFKEFKFLIFLFYFFFKTWYYSVAQNEQELPTWPRINLNLGYSFYLSLPRVWLQA